MAPPTAAGVQQGRDWVLDQAAALAAEHDARVAERADGEEARLLLDDAEIDARVLELVARAESASILTDKAECLVEVRAVAAAARALGGDEADGGRAGQPLSDEQRAALARVARRCAEVEGECVQHQTRADIGQLHHELSMLRADGDAEGTLGAMIDDHRRRAGHADAAAGGRGRAAYSTATQAALDELAALEGQQGAPPPPSEAQRAFELDRAAGASEEYLNAQDRMNELRLRCGVDFVFVAEGTFHVGMALRPPAEVCLAGRQWDACPPAPPPPPAAEAGAAPSTATPAGGGAGAEAPASAVHVEPANLRQAGKDAGGKVDLSPALARQQYELQKLDDEYKEFFHAASGRQLFGNCALDAPAADPVFPNLRERLQGQGHKAGQAVGPSPSLPPGGTGACRLHGGVLGDGGVLHDGAAPRAGAALGGGAELADVPAARAAQLLFRLPPTPQLLRHLRDGLHSAWTREQTRSAAALACAAPRDGAAPHFSCAPPQQVELDSFFVSADVVRLSHLRRLRAAMPAVAAALRAAGVDLRGDGAPPGAAPAWEVDVDRPCANARPLFADAVPHGLAWAPKDTAGVEGAVDEEDDPAAEVPFPVAEEIAAACGARLPTWQEWEGAARGGGGRLFPWGDDPAVPAIDYDVAPAPGGDGVALLRSFGWLRCAPSPLGLVGLCRYGAEWNSAAHDVGDATGGAAAPATTHVLRSLCDVGGAMRAPHRPGAAHRGFTLPAAAAYGLPHRATHCAAFRLVVEPPRRLRRRRGAERPPCVTHDVDLGSLSMLLRVSGDAAANRARVEGLLGPVEAVGAARGAGHGEEWVWPSKGCSVEVDPLCGLRVVSVTVYERAYDRPMWSRRFNGSIDGALRFPLSRRDVARAWDGAPAVRKGNCVFYRRAAAEWAWWAASERPPQERIHVGRMRPSCRFDAAQATLARVAFSDAERVQAVTLSLA